MSQQQQLGGTSSELGCTDLPHRLDAREATSAPRRSAARIGVVLLYVLIVGAFGIGAIYVNPARTAEGVERLSAVWTNILSAVHLAVVRPTTKPERAIATLQPPLSAEQTPAAPVAASEKSIIAYGDRLKVVFFESMPVSLGDLAPGHAASAPITIFPRMDLSGEYIVDEAGGLDIPRLGWRAVAGHGVGTLESQLAAAFQRAFGRSGTVHAALLDRRPIYVLGGPRGGVTIKHAPGIFVLQALAEVGGYQRDATDTSRAIEAIREIQRLGEAQDGLVRALVRHTRLTAMRDGLSTVTLAPVTAALLTKTFSHDAAELLEEANATLVLEEQAHANQLALANRQVRIANLELVAQELRVVQARALTESKASRLRGLEWVAARGSVTSYKVMDAVVDVAEAGAKQEDLRATVAQAQSRLVEAEVARAKLSQVHMSQLTLDIGAAAQEAGNLRRAVAAMRAVVAVLGEGREASLKTGAETPQLNIIRRGPDGFLIMPASETTPLMPGDVLQIGPSRGAAQPGIPDAASQPPGSDRTAAELTAQRHTSYKGAVP